MVVMAPTLGQTNYLAFGRVLGTFFGAGIALGFYVRLGSDHCVTRADKYQLIARLS